jgi:NADH-quinone oxidoreductase subunit C
MKTPQEIFEILKAQFGDAILGFNENALAEYTIDVAPLSIAVVGEYLRDTDGLLFNNLILLSALDDANGKKVTQPDGSFDFEGGTLSVVYHLESMTLKHKLTLRVVVPKEKPEIESLAFVWNHANWEEREAYDMIGIIFLNHPYLIRILMPYDWDAGFPLRKDYRNPEFYHGIKVPY